MGTTNRDAYQGYNVVDLKSAFGMCVNETRDQTEKNSWENEMNGGKTIISA
jgi:hypothetical protein